MKTFNDRWWRLDWGDIHLRINGETATDMERTLSASHLSRDDLIALLSPAVADCLEPLVQRAQKFTCRRSDSTVSFYMLLYLSNLCADDCTCCDFSMGNRIKRRTLDKDEITWEYVAIRELSFEHLLPVTGEH